ncbi:MAG TPA: P-II family nitrogen regulator [Burkholderiaceae bacterium]|nr:P-II family nitrogen regulator [Burkholderiaceae bacterium]
MARPASSPLESDQPERWSKAMEFKRIIAIIPNEALKPVEESLNRLRVGGMTVSRVKGYGEYKNLFRDDEFSEHTKVEIFIEAPRVDAIINALLDIERDGSPGAGIVAVIPVEKFLHLRTGTETLTEAPVA